MNPKINIDIETIKLIYKNYKVHIRYGAIILICFLVFAIISVPKMFQISGLLDARKNEEKKLEVLNKNYRLLTSIEEGILDFQLQTAVSALPEGKDFVGIINAISLASGKSGVSLDDYNFQVGSVIDKTFSVEGFPFMKLSLVVRASPQQLDNFLQSLSNTSPLSEVTSIKQTSGTTNLEAVFYFKPSVPSNMSDVDELNDLSSKEKDLLNTISSWNNFLPAPVVLQEDSSLEGF